MERAFWLPVVLAIWSALAYAQTENPVTNGSFERLDAKGFPVDWMAVGGPPTSEIGASNDAHSGQRSLRLKRVTDTPKVETGLNRAWTQDTGQQGAMLAQLKGGIIFWYKVPSAQNAKLNFYVIPMSEKPKEDTGEPRAFYTVPADHVGDGQWHKGAVKYDFSKAAKVKWIHVAPRIVGGTAEWLIDDISHVEKVGPIVRAMELRLTETPGKLGELCELTLPVENFGDAPAADVRAELLLPAYLKPADGPSAKTIKNLAPEARATFSWRVDGLRDKADTIRAKVTCNELVSGASLSLKPDLKILALVPERFILSRRDKVKLRCVLENRGSAAATGVTAKLTLPPDMPIVGKADTPPMSVKPTEQKEIEWTLEARVESIRFNAWVEVKAANCEGGEAQTRFIVGGLSAPSLAGVSQRAVAVSQRDAAALENHRVRLLFGHNTFGFGTAELFVRIENAWVGVAKLAALSRLVYETVDGKRVERPIYGDPEAVGRTGDVASLKFTRALSEPDGAQWQFEATFSLKTGDDLIHADYRLTCDKPRKLLCFDGPMLYAGEGSFGGEQDDAIFPGLEWLVKGERSSSDLDIAADHPHRIRYVPHPNMVTIPCMGVHRKGITVGLLWDVHQKWDGASDRPSAVFASPDYFDGRNAHLMGLFAPSVREWADMKQREAKTAYELPANKPLTLTAQLYADVARDSLAAMDRWFKLYGVPDPLPAPHGTYEKEVEFSMKGYLDSMWVADSEEWWTSKYGSPLMSKKARPTNYCFDLLMGALIVPNEPLAARYRERAHRVLSLAKSKPIADDDGFTWGDPAAHLVSRAGGAASALQRMRPDGSWRFDALAKRHGVFEKSDYRLIGPHDAAEVGTCAATCYHILRYARMSGDLEVFEACQKALKFMEQFTVPRAAQVWEVPLHTPDILAASDAVDAYLEAYRISGDKHYLAEAVRWARAGLPFLYVWNAPEFPFMRYGSIPVFGATWFRGSWFGRPVQWNGLRYAYALMKLWEHDQTMPWRKIAVGVVHSAMYQQEQDGEDVALWPDAISCFDAKKARWYFAPRMILKCVYEFMGYPSEPRTVIVRRENAAAYVSACAQITNAAWSGDELKCTVTSPAKLSSQVLVVGLSKPKEVLADGKPLPAIDPGAASEAGQASSYTYQPAYGLLVIRPAKPGLVALAVRGVQPQRQSLIPKQVERIAFDFETSPEGWLASHDLKPFEVEKGVLRTVATGGDPYMTRSRLNVDGSKVRAVVVRMSVTAGTSAELYWGTAESPVFAEDKVIRFPITPDGQFHDYRLDVSKHPLWSGKTIVSLRLDPTNGAPNAEAGVDWIRGE